MFCQLRICLKFKFFDSLVVLNLYSIYSVSLYASPRFSDGEILFQFNFLFIKSSIIRDFFCAFIDPRILQNDENEQSIILTFPSYVFIESNILFNSLILSLIIVLISSIFIYTMISFCLHCGQLVIWNHNDILCIWIKTI